MGVSVTFLLFPQTDMGVTLQPILMQYCLNDVDSHFEHFGILRQCLLSEMHPATVTTPETRALPRVPGPDSQAIRLRQPAARPRLDPPQDVQPHTSGEDDGLSVLPLQQTAVVFSIVFLYKCNFFKLEVN